MNQEILLESLVLIFFVGIFVQWFAWKTRLPSIILLLISGILMGPVFKLVPPSLQAGEAVHAILKLFLALILFEGGLQLKFHELKEGGTFTMVKRITTWGAALNFIFCALAAHYILELSWQLSFIIASILIVTGPTVILPLLKQSRIPKNLSSGLKWESIVVDPFGALLVVLFYEYAKSTDTGLIVFAKGFGLSLFISFALSYAAYQIIRFMIRRNHIPEHLKVPFILSLCFLIYLMSDLIQHESGLFTTTLFGIFLGNSRLPIMHELFKFKETTTVILISLIFIVLSANLDFHDLAAITSPKVVLFLFVIIVLARPIALHISLINTPLSFKERSFIAWIAPRGVVAAAVVDVFAPKLVDAGFPEAQILVPLIFAVIFSTVLIHGFGINILAKLLKLNETTSKGLLIVGSNPWTLNLAKTLKEMEYPLIMADQEWNRLIFAKMDNLPIFYGEVLSDLSEESLDLTNISKVLAATDNDSYNALVCNHFSSKLGRENVFQLPMHNFDTDQNKGVMSHLKGQIVVGKDEYFEELSRCHYLGWHFQKTKLTDEFPYEKFLEVNTEGSKMILLKRGESIFFHTHYRKLEPKKGDTLVTFAPPSTS